MGVQPDPGRPWGRLLTIPNALSLARLIGVPVFLWLVLVPKADLWALVVLVFAGISDWLDGKLARAWNQTSRLGQLLDPAADRLYIVATLVGLVARDIVPMWLAVALVAREVFLALLLPVLHRHGYGPWPVHFLGKAATLCLLYAFPLLFLGDHPGDFSMIAKIVGWAFAIWGTALYWWAGALYAIQVRRLVAADRDAAVGAAHGGAVRDGADRADRAGPPPDLPDDRKGATARP